MWARRASQGARTRVLTLHESASPAIEDGRALTLARPPRVANERVTSRAVARLVLGTVQMMGATLTAAMIWKAGVTVTAIALASLTTLLTIVSLFWFRRR